MDLKKKFKQYGWTSAKVADALNISAAALCQQVKNGMTVARLEEIAEIMGVPTSQLLTDDDGELPRSSAPVCPHCGKPINITLT